MLCPNLMYFMCKKSWFFVDREYPLGQGFLLSAIFEIIKYPYYSVQI